MEPFIGQIIMFAGNFAPHGWAFCDGQLLPIAQNTALFSILGTTYGGDGATTFALPDLRGRVPIHPGNGPGLSPYQLGQKGGAESVTLTTQNLPSHTHSFVASTAQASSREPAGMVPAATEQENSYHDATNLSPMSGSAIQPTGNGVAHSNIQPFGCVNYIIALQGVFPSAG